MKPYKIILREREQQTQNHSRRDPKKPHSRAMCERKIQSRLRFGFFTLVDVSLSLSGAIAGAGARARTHCPSMINDSNSNKKSAAVNNQSPGTHIDGWLCIVLKGLRRARERERAHWIRIVSEAVKTLTHAYAQYALTQRFCNWFSEAHFKIGVRSVRFKSLGVVGVCVC